MGLHGGAGRGGGPFADAEPVPNLYAGGLAGSNGGNVYPHPDIVTHTSKRVNVWTEKVKVGFKFAFCGAGRYQQNDNRP